MRLIALKSSPSDILIAQLLWMVLLVLTMALLPAAGNAMSSKPEEVTDHLKDRWGIEIIGIRSSAANYMLDFRYRVVDAEKAQPLFRRKSRPQLISQKTGAKMNVFSSPKTGPMRTSDPPKAGRNYFILFANPGRHIQVGDQVTVVIDDFRVENLAVQ